MFSAFILYKMYKKRYLIEMECIEYWRGGRWGRLVTRVTQ